MLQKTSVMLRSALVFACFLVAHCQATAQQPQVSVNLDLRPTVRVSEGGKFRFDWYDSAGHHSVVSVTMLTEVGFRAFVSQRLEVIPGDADNEFLNEYYVEDAGYWRIGKQLLPFGLQELERELVTAARADTRFAIGGWPLRIAWCGGKEGQATGYVARLGTTWGLSIASGRHFGVSALAFQAVRKPEESSGPGTGYRDLYGADLTYRFRRFSVQAEWVRTRRGHTPTDYDNDFALLRIVYDLGGESSVALTVARDFRLGTDIYHLRHSLRLHEQLDAIQRLRWNRGRLDEASFGVRLRL